LSLPEEPAPPPEREPKQRKQPGAPADEGTRSRSGPGPTAAPGDKRVKHATEIAHHTPGRLRLKVKAAKNNPALLEQIKAVFSKVPGIERIEIRAATGSVILYYDPENHPDISTLFHSLNGAAPGSATVPIHAPPRRAPINKVEEVAEQIEQEAEFLAEHSTFARAIVEYAKHLDRQLKRATDNNIDLKILVPIGLAAFTFLEIGATAATPMWVTLVIFSLNHFVELHAHDADQPPTQDG
jgi:hypothetical protein